MNSRGWLGLGIAVVSTGGFLAVGACGGSDAVGNVDASVDASPLPALDGTTGQPSDGGADDAGDTPVTDGGANIDLDAGDDPEGADGGPCNTETNAAVAITSSCISVIPGFGGGDLVAGTYALTAVNDLGSAAFCTNRFIPVGFKETMILTVDVNGVGIANTVTALGNGPTRRRTVTLDPGATPGATMTIAPTCPVTPSSTVAYSSNVRVGKQTIRLRLPYGTGEAVYVFEKQ